MAAYIIKKKAAVDQFMQRLEKDNNTDSLSDEQREEILGQLKVYGRDPRGSDAIYCEQGIKILGHYGFGDYPPTVYLEALRCIANALLLQEQLRRVFMSIGFATSIAQRYRQQNDDSEFLGARILFLLTYETKTDFESLIETHKLAESISSHIERHASASVSGGTATSSSPLTTIALTETLKLLFNIAYHCPSEVTSLSVAVPHLFDLLIHDDITQTPLSGSDLTGVILNALAVLEHGSMSTPAARDTAQIQHTQVAKKLIDILKASTGKYTPAQLDTQAIPLMTVLRELYATASTETRSVLQKLLLPDDSERDLPLGQSSSLASKLLRLTVSPGLSNIPEAVSSLMFEMSNKDASTFVKNIGYGYAAGYLMTHKIPIPESARTTQSAAVEGSIPVNPVTGQRLDKEVVPDVPEMTEEEKEREAERLFVLFERLKATGIVDVKNPVQQAMEDGKFGSGD